MIATAPRAAPRRLRKEDGFTIIEVLIALGILVVGMLGIIALLAVATRSHTRAKHAVNATMIATSEIADARHKLSNSRAALSSAATAKFQKHKLYPRYDYKVDVVPLDRDGREVYVRVTVRWKQRGRNVEEVFETIVLRRR